MDGRVYPRSAGDLVRYAVLDKIVMQNFTSIYYVVQDAAIHRIAIDRYIHHGIGKEVRQAYNDNPDTDFCAAVHSFYW